MSLNPNRLTALMQACDFTYAELETIAGEFLGLTGEAAQDVMRDISMQRKIADLVGWADRQGQLDNLTTGVLGYGRSKRAIREWVLSEDMTATGASQPPADTYNLFRLESKVDRILERQDLIIAEQGDLRHRVATVESVAQGLHMRQQAPTIDRVMVAMLAVAMLAMLAFNLLVTR